MMGCSLRFARGSTDVSSESGLTLSQASKIIDRKVSSTIWQQNGTKLTSTTFFAWKLFVTVCYDWPAFLDKTALTPNTNYWQAWTKMVRYTGMLLQPLLPLSLRGAFAYWRRRKQLPKVRFVPSAPQPPPPHTHAHTTCIIFGTTLLR